LAEERFFHDMSSTDPESLTPADLTSIAREAGIIDEADGRRLWKKIAQATREGIDSIVVDALDDEPYISSQLCMVVWMGEELCTGINFLRRAIGAERVSIEVYRNLFDIDLEIPAQIGPYKVRRVGGNYPAEQRSRSKWHRRSLVVGACALIHLQRAVLMGRAQTSCFVSVAGDCVANPANYELPLGCTIQQVLDATGILAVPKRIVAGGSMTGFGISDPETVTVAPATRGILAFADQFEDFGYTCIGCGRCIDACPQDLSPYYLYKLLRAKRSKLALADANDCTGCGACSYICPAKLELAQQIYSVAAANRRRGGEP
jgi:Na+-translocating ferredoxin:NAD+ oxidoreductase RnfC subunit